jgi:hypothetical protein
MPPVFVSAIALKPNSHSRFSKPPHTVYPVSIPSLNLYALFQTHSE